jgi:hypothetical protein
VERALADPGAPLQPTLRKDMERRFGDDFSRVRVHTGATAQRSARALNAHAYTLGNDIVFGAGKFAPGTATGQSLLAHELAHTVQQRAAGAPRIQRKLGDGHDLSSARLAGDIVLEAVFDNERVLKRGSTGATVRRLQLALVDTGHLQYRFVNEKFDANTETAVENFQKDSGFRFMTSTAGVVDAATIGWLDQRLSAGRSPPGKTPGGTPGCASIKTVNVDLVSLHGSTGDMFGDLTKANTIFNQCCVRFAVTGGGFESEERTRALLGGDTVLNKTGDCRSPTAEEVSMFRGAAADFSLSGRIRAFYVQSAQPASADMNAYSFAPYCATAGGAAARNMVVMTNQASASVLAHEFGHILLNQGNSAHDDMDPEFLMNSGESSTPGARITPTQCDLIFKNA